MIGSHIRYTLTIHTRIYLSYEYRSQVSTLYRRKSHMQLCMHTVSIICTSEKSAGALTFVYTSLHPDRFYFCILLIHFLSPQHLGQASYTQQRRSYPGYQPVGRSIKHSKPQISLLFPCTSLPIRPTKGTLKPPVSLLARSEAT